MFFETMVSHTKAMLMEVALKVKFSKLVKTYNISWSTIFYQKW